MSLLRASRDTLMSSASICSVARVRGGGRDREKGGVGGGERGERGEEGVW